MCRPATSKTYPVTNRKTVNIAIFTLPACKAPPITLMMALMKRAIRRPSLSACGMHESAPKRPPTWKRPFMVPIMSGVLGLVSRPKYALNVGWPSVVAMMELLYPYERLPNVTKRIICDRCQLIVPQIGHLLLCRTPNRTKVGFMVATLYHSTCVSLMIMQ